MRTVWAIALGAAAFRFLLFRGLDLYADEAYYWMWSRRPAIGYFDHPPMVAWLIRAGTALLPGELGVRLLFLLCGALAVVFAALIAREMSDDPRVPAVAAILAATSPILMLTGGLALPDAPVTAAYAGATWLVARARGRGWIAAGVVGRARAPLQVHRRAARARRSWSSCSSTGSCAGELRTPWPWLGGAVAILVFLPNLLWNASHGWVAILFQGRHGLGSQATVRSFLEFVGGLLGGAGVVALPLGLWRLARGRDSFTLRVAAATLAPIAVTALSALRGPVEANWAALAYPALCGAAAVELVRLRPAWSQGLLAFTVGLGMIAAVGFGLEVRNPGAHPARQRGDEAVPGLARVRGPRRASPPGSPAGRSATRPAAAPGTPSSTRRATRRPPSSPSTPAGPASAPRPSAPPSSTSGTTSPAPARRSWSSGTSPRKNGYLRRKDPGPAATSEVRMKGKLLHPIEVTAWRTWQGPSPAPRDGLTLPEGCPTLAEPGLRAPAPPARFFEREEDGRLRCTLCPRECLLGEGQAGFCSVRENQGGEMVLLAYGKSTGFAVDPIEKKPLYHFLPGTEVLSFGTVGCNLGCRFCQNWNISKARASGRGMAGQHAGAGGGPRRVGGLPVHRLHLQRPGHLGRVGHRRGPGGPAPRGPHRLRHLRLRGGEGPRGDLLLDGRGQRRPQGASPRTSTPR